MVIGAGFCMYDFVIYKFTFAISSPDEFLLNVIYDLNTSECCLRLSVVLVG